MRPAYYIFFCFVFIHAAYGDWSYTNQSAWGGQCKTGKHQSPINIVHNIEVAANQLPPLRFINLDRNYSADVTNNGESVIIKIPGKIKPILYGGGFLGKYIFSNLHYHWPSEHRINGQKFDLELHIGFYSNKYRSAAEARKHKDGSIILSVFANKQQVGNGPEVFNVIAKAAEAVHEKVNTKSKIKSIIINDVLPHCVNGFLSYKGSFTTPDCAETVTRVILKGKQLISAKQYKTMTTINGNDGKLLKFNNRRLQPVNGRKVQCKKYLN